VIRAGPVRRGGVCGRVHKRVLALESPLDRTHVLDSLLVGHYPFSDSNVQSVRVHPTAFEVHAIQFLLERVCSIQVRKKSLFALKPMASESL
jgi:hypothetical protein